MIEAGSVSVSVSAPSHRNLRFNLPYVAYCCRRSHGGGIRGAIRTLSLGGTIWADEHLLGCAPRVLRLGFIRLVLLFLIDALAKGGRLADLHLVKLIELLLLI